MSIFQIKLIFFSTPVDNRNNPSSEFDIKLTNKVIKINNIIIAVERIFLSAIFLINFISLLASFSSNKA